MDGFCMLFRSNSVLDEKARQFKPHAFCILAKISVWTISRRYRRPIPAETRFELWWALWFVLWLSEIRRVIQESFQLSNTAIIFFFVTLVLSFLCWCCFLPVAASVAANILGVDDVALERHARWYFSRGRGGCSLFFFFRGGALLHSNSVVAVIFSSVVWLGLISCK